MTEPILPINLDNLTTLVGAGVVGAYMLFPDDPAGRARVMQHFAVRDSMVRLEIGSPGGVVTTSTKGMVDLVSMALDAASPSEIAKYVAKQAPLGIGAGMIVYKAVQKPDSVTDATNEVGAALFRSRAKTSKHVHKVVRRRFKPVAALWAAWVHLDDGGDSPAEFPCRPSEMPGFLSLAEAFRALAEETSTPVLPRGVSMRPPGEVLANLPGGALAVPI